MGKRKRKHLTSYVAKVQDEMKLGEWRLHISVGSLDSRCAQVSINYQQREAWIEFDKGWKNESAEELRQTVVHELCHLLTNTLFIPIRQAEMAMGKKEAKLIHQSACDWLEEMTDGFARRIAPNMPLIGGKQ